MTSVSDEHTERLTEQEDVVLVVLVQFEDFGITLWGYDLVTQDNWLSINFDVVQVIEFDGVLSHNYLNSEFVVADLLSKYNKPWLVAAVSRDESFAFRKVSEISSVVVGLDGMRSNITISIDSEGHGCVLELRESREDWSLKWSWQEVQVDTVEVFLFSLRAVEVDISFWVFFVHGHI